ncbi:NADPH:quinone oxidoreductase family protein [Roseicyclus persicicus]|uniref:NADPH:quinone oxidoreductase family protein n=1 Tax=Roseicyclus persicicus TaxID=2650661 RepID=A0A7X6GXT8_9RHOB|nr:NADPH:quinone oxidoreductase family protein [Roseibacterium persicicum]NKX44391.1 NADPH:quinone oxidoreductase family protein [Roseibacterium persicicum]
MRAFQVQEIGAEPGLAELPLPEPGPGEIRVRIAACGLNFADLLMIKGQYQDTPPAPFTLGMELSGVVDALGPGVGGPAPGTRVAVFAGKSGLAEYGVFEAARAVPIPDAMTFEEAAGFLVAYGTSHLALAHRAGLKPGERLLVLGAAGGVGLTAVELGAVMGAEVIAVARGADKLAVARAAGATHLIDSETADLRAALKALGGVDVVYDAVGGAAFDAALRAARPEGRVLVIGFASGEVPQIPANLLLVKNISVLGLYWGGYLRFAPEVLTASLSELMALYAAGRIRPHVSATFPLERAAEALALLKSRRSTGKVVVTM